MRPPHSPTVAATRLATRACRLQSSRLLSATNGSSLAPHRVLLQPSKGATVQNRARSAIASTEATVENSTTAWSRKTGRAPLPSRSSAQQFSYHHYILPALATQTGLTLFSSGIHLEAASVLLPDGRTVQPANAIPYIKTEIIKEAQRPSFWRRLKRYLEDMLEEYVIHPVKTIWRFGVLAVIFLPLILTAPAVFIGQRQKEFHDERSGTIWWYNLLVRHMEMAGPTFIKVNEFGIQVKMTHTEMSF